MNIPDDQRAEIAAAFGKQPWEIDFVVSPNGEVDVIPARRTTAEGTFAGTALQHGIANAPGAAIGATAGVGAMTALGPMIAKGAELLRPFPGGSVTAPVAKFLGNAAAFAAPATLAKAGVESIGGVGDFKRAVIGGDAQAMRDRIESPWATSTGEFLSNFAGQGIPDFKNLGSGAAKLATLRRLATRDMGLSTAESAALQNAGGGMALGGGLELARELKAGEGISPLDIAKHGLLGVANSGDVRKPLRRVGEGLVHGVGRVLSGGHKLINVPATKQKTEAEILAEFAAKTAAPAPTTADPAPVDPLAAAMAMGREATGKLRDTEGVPQPYGAGSLRDRVAAWRRPEVPVEGPPIPPERPFTTADVQPENTLGAAPTTRDVVQRLLPGRTTAEMERPAQPGEGTGTRGRPQPAQDTRTEAERMQDQLEGTGAKYQEIEQPLRFGQGPRNPVTQEFDARQTQGDQAAYDAEMAAREKMNEVGRGVEGLVTANPMMLPAGVLRKATTADKPESMDLMGRLRAGKGQTGLETGDMTPPPKYQEATTAEPESTGTIPGAKALERRGFDYETTDAPIPVPGGKLARGSFDPATGRIVLAEPVVNETTAKHEGMHAELQDMLLSGNPRLEKLAAEMTVIAGEEPLAEGGAVASNAQEKTNRLRRLLEDNWNWLRTTTFGSDKSPERLARVLAERFDFQAPGPVKTGAAGTVKPQDMEDRPFVSGTEAFLMRGAPGVTFRRDSIVPESFNAWLSKQPRAEQELMAQAGLNEIVARGATADELVAHLRANGPKVNVLDYGMDGKPNKARADFDQAFHELETLGYHANTAGRLMRRGNFNAIDRDNPNVPENVWRLVDRLGAAERKAARTFDSGPRATSAYNRVSAFPTDEPMPEWTASKLKNNVQRVDVAIPHSDTVEAKSDSGLDKFGPSYRNNDPMWQPDGLHENVPNTLGWAMLQYKTGPNGEKIAVIAESQSRWGQTVRNAKQNPGEATGFERTAKDHPLLADYNRLILKAAVEQARKEGATHIMLSDGETAMMTEGHDAVQGSAIIDSPENRALAQRMIEQGSAGSIYRDIADGKVQNVASPASWKHLGFKLEPQRPSQEGGMRFNYDKAMPKIASEMLGDGQRISLGEHKNAIQVRQAGEMANMPWVVENTTTGQILRARTEAEARALAAARTGRFQDQVWEAKPNAELASVGKPREDLIFRNPDGSPKTDASGMMYPIDAIATRRAAGEPMTLTGKRYQAMETEITDFDADGFPTVKRKLPAAEAESLLKRRAAYVEKLMACLNK